MKKQQISKASSPSGTVASAAMPASGGGVAAREAAGTTCPRCQRPMSEHTDDYGAIDVVTYCPKIVAATEPVVRPAMTAPEETWAAVDALYRQRNALQREVHEIDARIYELQGDPDTAQFYREMAAGTPLAYERLRAKQFLATGEHYKGDTAEQRATIERLAAELSLVRAAASEVVRGAQATAQIIGGES